MFAVCVSFDVIPGRMEDFLPEMRRQASNSLSLEPDCHVFDICTDAERGSVFLYELYTDSGAFQRHLESAHFLAFDAAVAPMVRSKTVRTYAEVIRS